MNLSDKESLIFLSKQGYNVSRSYLTRIKKGIRESSFSRLSLIAREEWISQHLQRIDTLNLIQTELFKLYHKESNIFKKAMILKELRELQQYISAYYDSSRFVLQQSVQERTASALEQKKKKRKAIIEQ